MRYLVILAATACLALPAVAQSPAPAAKPTATAAPVKAAKPAKAPTDPNLVLRESANSVKDTMDKLAKAVEAKGAKVVARVDHAAGAKVAGVDMKPSEVLIFGNPKLGTPVMAANVRAGIDLPMKVLAYEDAAGKVWVAYTKPGTMQRRYKLTSKEQTASVKAIGDALDGLTGAAIVK